MRNQRAILRTVFTNAVDEMTGTGEVKTHIGISIAISISTISDATPVKLTYTIFVRITIQVNPIPITRGRRTIGVRDSFSIGIIVSRCEDDIVPFNTIHIQRTIHC